MQGGWTNHAIRNLNIFYHWNVLRWGPQYFLKISSHTLSPYYPASAKFLKHNTAYRDTLYYILDYFTVWKWFLCQCHFQRMKYNINVYTCVYLCGMSVQTVLPTSVASKINYHSSVRIHNPHDHLCLQQSICKLWILQQHGTSFTGVILNTQLHLFHELKHLFWWQRSHSFADCLRCFVSLHCLSIWIFHNWSL